MRYLLISFLLSSVLFANGGGQPVNIPINSPGTLGYGQSVSQDLGVTPLHFQPYGGYGVYTLTFTESNPDGNYTGRFEVELNFGTQNLCDSYGWGTAPSMQVTVICPSPGYLIVDQALPGGGLVQGNKNLVVTWTVNDGSFDGGWPVNFDNVSLMFTPTN